MCQHVEPPVGVTEQFFRVCGEQGRVDLIEDALVSYFGAYREYAQRARCGDVHCCARLCAAGDIGLPSRVGGSGVGDDRAAAGGAGICEATGDGAGSSTEWGLHDVADRLVRGEPGDRDASCAGGAVSSPVVSGARGKSYHRNARKRRAKKNRVDAIRDADWRGPQVPLGGEPVEVARQGFFFFLR